MLRVSDVNQQGRVIGLASRRTADRRECWGVFKPSGNRTFKTCDYYLDAFSPDGHRILAERSKSQFWSVRRFAILGQDGHVVSSWTFDASVHRSLNQLTWEDSHHLLGVLMAHGQWGIVRIGTDGSVEYAGPTVDGDRRVHAVQPARALTGLSGLLCEDCNLPPPRRVLVAT